METNYAVYSGRGASWAISLLGLIGLGNLLS